jgi:hypothetical protein
MAECSDKRLPNVSSDDSNASYDGHITPLPSLEKSGDLVSTAGGELRSGPDKGHL